ncbi:MAG: phosphotransferase, partial [Pirellulales bacterium]
MYEIPPVSLDLAQLIQAHYSVGCRPEDVSCWQSGQAFSGARIWKVGSRQGRFALRRWPGEFRDRARLSWVQAVLRHAQQRGVTYLAVPLDTREGAPCFAAEGHLWELAPWLPGEANDQTPPSEERLRAAMQALAWFHAAVADFPGASDGPAPVAVERRDACARWLNARLLADLSQQIDASVDRELATSARRYLAQCVPLLPNTGNQLTGVCDSTIPILPCLRDVWTPHVLFQQAAVSGIIDYGAMRFDTPAACISRLLASLAGDDPAAWRIGLAAYGEVRALSAMEQRLIRVLDLAATLISGMNWLEWIFLQRRSFDDPRWVRRRLELAADRLERLVTGE